MGEERGQAVLHDRAVLRVAGADALKFLQDLITNDVAKLSERDACHAALLTPQGKILFDFFVVRTAEGFLLDMRADQRDALAKRLTFYRLRAKVEIDPVPHRVIAWWGEGAGDERPDGLCAATALATASPQDARGGFRDPREPAMGWRMIVPATPDIEEDGADADAAGLGAYHAHRIAVGVAEGGLDYAFGGAFPHEANFDLKHGVDFTKGCFVGQEVVSRMQHRGTARKRIIAVAAQDADEPLPGPALAHEVRAGAALLGTLGSVSGDQGLALIRVDRLAEMAREGVKMEADGVALRVRRAPGGPELDL